MKPLFKVAVSTLAGVMAMWEGHRLRTLREAQGIATRIRGQPAWHL